MYKIYRNLRGGTKRLRDISRSGGEAVFLIILKYNSS
jgi:hypothetical protein